MQAALWMSKATTDTVDLPLQSLSGNNLVNDRHLLSESSSGLLMSSNGSHCSKSFPVRVVWISLINHLSPVCPFSILNQLVCQFHRMENIFNTRMPSTLTGIFIVSCVRPSVCPSGRPEWQRYRSIFLYFLKIISCIISIWLGDAQYHEADHYLKWPCSANYCAFHETFPW